MPDEKVMASIQTGRVSRTKSLDLCDFLLVHIMETHTRILQSIPPTVLHVFFEPVP